MKQEWSSSWVRSIQPRKQRKYRHQAPLHTRHRFLAAHLSEDLKREIGKRALPVRKGDEVRVLRGSFRRSSGVIDHVDLKNSRVYVDGIKVKKVDGSDALRPLNPSNLLLVKLNLSDKWRKSIVGRKHVSSKGKTKSAALKVETKKPVHAESKKAPAKKAESKKSSSKKKSKK